MLPNSDPEALRRLVDQRQEEVRRAAADSRLLASLMAGATRRWAGLAGLPGRVARLRPSRPSA